MLATFPVPILSVTAEAVRDLQGQDALYSLWTGQPSLVVFVFTHHSLSPFISLYKVQRVCTGRPPSGKHLLAIVVPRAHQSPALLPVTHPQFDHTTAERHPILFLLPRTC